MIDKISGNDVYGYTDQKKRKNPAVNAYENTSDQKEAAKPKAGQKRSANNMNASGQDRQGVILDLSNKAMAEKTKAAEDKKGFSVASVLQKLFAPVIRWLKDFWESDTSVKASVDSDLPSGESAMEKTGGLSAAATMEEAITAETAEDEQSAVFDTASETAAETAADGAEEADQAYEILKSSQTEIDMEELPPLEEIDDLPRYGSIPDEAIKSGNLQQIEQLLTRNGARQLAHNSDLLTYYDRFGKLIEIDESDRHRVLFGDKNVMKL